MGLGEEADIAYDQQKERWMEATNYMNLAIDKESVNIYLDFNCEADPDIIPLFYWHIDEVKEDPEVAISIANAVHYFHTNKYGLIKMSTYR